MKNAIRWGLAAAAAALLLFVVPVPCVLYEPGMVVPVGGLAVVGDAAKMAHDRSDHPDQKGEWLLTTVYLRTRAALWPVIESTWRADREAHNRRAVFGGSGAEEYAVRMNVLMAESQSKAVEAAYRAAGVRYEAEPDGVYVARSTGRLKAGDRIEAVDGAAVHGLDGLAAALRSRGSGEAELTVRRGGQEIAVRLAVNKADADKPRDLFGGAELIEIRAIRPFDPADQVTIASGSFAGPSAGLPLALHIYEELTGESLTGGRRIAATGTIEPSGAIGAVGGVTMKAIAAAHAGADLFLVPEANAAAAAAAGGGMAVAGVATLDEAVSLLRASHSVKPAP